MMRVHSTLLLGRQLLPSASLRPVAAASHRLSWLPKHLAGKSHQWPPAIAARSAAAASPGGCNFASWACSKMQLGSTKSHNWASSLAFLERANLSRRYATVGADGDGGSRSGSGNRGGPGGPGGGGSGEGAGEEGRWRIWAWYLGLLDTNPILTKAVTSAILTFIGDVFCQYVVEKSENLDGKRVAVMTFLGFGLVGPTLHYWYTTLSELVTVGGPAGVGIRLILDQFVFSPTFIGIFISSLMVLEGNSKQITAKLKQDWWSAVLVNWQLWIPAQIINFWLVPLKLQVAFANFTALFWNAYLSYKSHLEVQVPQSLTTESKT